MTSRNVDTHRAQEIKFLLFAWDKTEQQRLTDR